MVGGRVRGVSFAIGVLLIACAVMRAADPAIHEPGPIRVQANLVLVPVSVTDIGNHPVTGLTLNNFRVFEGKAEQAVRRVYREDAPLSIGILMDTSESMAGKSAKATEAVAQFLDNANEEDEFFLVNFNSKPELAVPFTSSGDKITARLRSVACQGKTALLDAVYLALNYMPSARNRRKALLVISDGGDNHSRYNEREINRLLRESDAWIYTIGIYAGGTPLLPEEERGGPKLLTDIAQETGGRHFAVNTTRDLPNAVAIIGQQLRNQYIIEYSPHDITPDGKYRRVRVETDPRNLRLSWRTGYYAPTQ